MIGLFVLFVNTFSPIAHDTVNGPVPEKSPPDTAPYVTLDKRMTAPEVVLDTLIDGAVPLQISSVVFTIVKFGLGLTVTVVDTNDPLQEPKIGRN